MYLRGVSSRHVLCTLLAIMSAAVNGQQSTADLPTTDYLTTTPARPRLPILGGDVDVSELLSTRVNATEMGKMLTEVVRMVLRLDGTASPLTGAFNSSEVMNVLSSVDWAEILQEIEQQAADGNGTAAPPSGDYSLRQVLAYMSMSYMNVSDACKLTLESLRPDVNPLATMTTVFMIDASGKMGTGVIPGNVVWLGNRAWCNLIKRESTTLERFNISFVTDAKYCGVRISGMSSIFAMFGNPTQDELDYGACVPSVCSESDVTYLSNTVLAVFSLPGISLGKGFVTKHVRCDADRDWSYSTGETMFIVVLTILVLLMLAGCAIDMTHRKAATSELGEPIHKEPSPGNGIGNTLRRIGGNLRKNRSAENSGDKDGKMGENSVDLTSQVINGDVQTGDETIDNSTKVKNNSGACGRLSQILLCFSPITNGEKIVNVAEKRQGMLYCLHGIRTLSMFWIILGHTYYCSIFALSNVGINVHDWMSQTTKLSFINATFAVDSFFFMSGLLVAYIAMKKLWKQESLCSDRRFWKLYHLHRYWRLTPLYMFVIFYWSTLYLRSIDGTMWYHKADALLFQKRQCDLFWFTNLLYVNNFYPPTLGGACLGWSWYLANDWQFYLFSPILLIIFYKYRFRTASAVSLSLAAFGMVLLALQAGVYDLGPEGFITSESYDEKKEYVLLTGDRWDMIYIKPWSRCVPYLVGMTVGALLARRKKLEMKINKVLVWSLWLITIITIYCIIYGYHFKHDHLLFERFSQVESISWHLLSRGSWSAALAWLVIACVSGNGGFVNTILSHSLWVPLSRLTYAAYLIHIPIIYLWVMNMDGALMLNDWNYTLQFISFTVMSYAAAFLLSVMVESPCLALEKLLLAKKDDNNSSSNTKQVDEGEKPDGKREASV